MMGRGRVPYLPQMEAMECGAACLAMVLAAWGHHAPQGELRQACKINRDGANAADLLAAAKAFGLEAGCVAVDLPNLGDLPLPAILHWEFKHFVVLERLTSKGAIVVDPATGRRSVVQRELATCFTGAALVFAPGPDFRPRRRRPLGISRYLEILRGLRPVLAQVLGASLMLQLAGLVLPVANQLLVDRVILPHHPPWLWGLALGVGLALAASVLLSLLRSYLLQGLRCCMDRRLAQGFVGHLLSLPLGFFLQRQPGELLQRVHSTSQIRELLSGQTVAAILDAFMLLGYLGLMLAYHPSLGLLVAALALLQAAALLALRWRNQQLVATELAVAGQESAILVEALNAMETVQAVNAQDYVLGRWWPQMVRRLNTGRQRQRLRLGLDQALVILQGLSAAVVFLVGGRAVLQERMTLGVFVAFLTLQTLFLAPLTALLEAWRALQQAAGHFQRLDDVLDCSPEASGSLDPGRLRGAIQLEGVSFCHGEGAPWILCDLNLEIRPGEKVALVGRTGAGKSTLARLLLGMHPPTRGQIRFDGLELARLDLAALRRQVGVVLQEPFLFDDTVRANLSLRDPDMPMERVRWAAELAQIHRTIERLPQGYQTRLGENGRLLSGGERQRLCLARALALEPAILLLDEATSALDLETERKVHAGLGGLGCTRILIAHRLETVRDADRILVLDQGRLAAQGTFRELEEKGLFRDLVQAMAAGHG